MLQTNSTTLDTLRLDEITIKLEAEEIANEGTEDAMVTAMMARVRVRPKGYEKKGFEDWVWKLKKSIYGLKQASKDWHDLANKTLKEMGFKPCATDNCVFTKEIPTGLFYIVLYVDDLLLTTKDMGTMNEIKRELIGRWNISDLGPAHKFVGLTVTRNRSKRTIHLSQGVLLEDTLDCAGLLDCNSCKSPFDKRMDSLKHPSIIEKQLVNYSMRRITQDQI
jgi:hypothetical protein